MHSGATTQTQSDGAGSGAAEQRTVGGGCETKDKHRLGERASRSGQSQQRRRRAHAARALRRALRRLVHMAAHGPAHSNRDRPGIRHIRAHTRPPRCQYRRTHRPRPTWRRYRPRKKRMHRCMGRVHCEQHIAPAVGPLHASRAHTHPDRPAVAATAALPQRGTPTCDVSRPLPVHMHPSPNYTLTSRALPAQIEIPIAPPRPRRLLPLRMRF